ncbi:polysaccharide biosynthesis protein CapD, partial [mine drainage metagenome]
MNLNQLKTLEKRWIAVSHDVFWIPLAIGLAYWVDAGLRIRAPLVMPGVVVFVMIALPVYGLAFFLFGCYRGIWRFASLPDLVRIVKAVAAGTVAVDLVLAGLGDFARIPRVVWGLTPILLVIGTGGGRMVYRLAKEEWNRFGFKTRKRALIVGAGRTGEQLVRELLRHADFAPIAFVDDKPELQGHEIHGVRVMGRLEDLPAL